MSDLYERVVSQQDALKKLIAKLPGFKGYFIRTDRRSADKLLRESIADKFQAHRYVINLRREWRAIIERFAN